MSDQQTCPCVKRHSPRPSYLQVHHILPKSWGGKDVTDNKIALCGTTHDATHDLLNKMVRAAKAAPTDHPAKVPLPTSVTRSYPALAVALAIRAWVAYAEAHGRAPTAYTVQRAHEP